MRVKHDLLLNMEKLLWKCEMWHSYTGWISEYKQLQCIQSTTRGLWLTVHVRKHIGANTHREHWSARGLPTESHNWQTLQRWLQTPFWQLLKWGLLWTLEVPKTDFTVHYVKYIPPCHVITTCTVFTRYLSLTINTISLQLSIFYAVRQISIHTPTTL